LRFHSKQINNHLLTLTGNAQNNYVPQINSQEQLTRVQLSHLDKKYFNYAVES